MKTRAGRVISTVAVAGLAIGIGLVSDDTHARNAVPHGGGGGARMAVPSHGHASASGAAAPRGHVPAHGTASGTAHWGYGHGYGYPHGGYWYGYPWWGWGWGWYGSWWWGWPYDYYGYPYASYYGYYGDGPDGGDYGTYAYAPAPHGPATIKTTVTPQDAEVVLDGESVGFASDYNGRWDWLRVKAGAHTIAFRAKGYKTLTVDFTASPGAEYKFNDVLAPGSGDDHRTVEPPAAPPQAEHRPPPQHQSPSDPPRPPLQGSMGPAGRLRVQVVPPDAAVYIDGEYLGLGIELGRIHGALAVPTGSHRLEAVRPGYVTATKTVEVGETDVSSVELTLERER